VAKSDTPTLLCWHSERAGIEVVENMLANLRKREIQINQVLYLVQADSNAVTNIPDQIEGTEIKKVLAELKDPTEHQAIYDYVRDQVIPLLKGLENCLHLNVSPGTPAMHSVWLMLFAGGAFPLGAQLWSSQYDPDTKRTRVKPVDFPIKTYMAEIRADLHANPEVPGYDPEPESPVRAQALRRLKQYSGLTGHPLLLLGERGTGKTRLVERYVSKIKSREVVALACGGLKSSVAESLLFGHVKGAFTGAQQERKGLIGEADGKLLFLDEVQDLPRNVQRELVRTLQDREHKYRQLGSDKEKKSDFELVCASNLSFEKLQQELYPDFFDRIAHLIVEVPPLRSCREDIQSDWQKAWDECRKSERIPKQVPESSQLDELFRTSNLQGNFRDLQRLAVLVMVWLDEVSEKEAIETAVAEWKRWERLNKQDSNFGFGSWKERTAWFHKNMAAWAVQHYGSAKDAANHLDCTERTISDYYKKITK